MKAIDILTSQCGRLFHHITLYLAKHQENSAALRDFIIFEQTSVPEQL